MMPPGYVLMAGVWVLCGEQFEYDHSMGRPRAYCLVCRPADMSVVKLKNGRRKLRRRKPQREANVTVTMLGCSASRLIFGSGFNI
jgi:hypothetical protein